MKKNGSFIDRVNNTFDRTIESLLFFFLSYNDFFILRDDGHLRAKWNRNAICRSPRRPSPLCRVSPSQNHHTITLIRVSFIFRSPFFFFLLLPSPSRRANEALPSTVNEAALDSTNFEVPVGFWCSHQLFPPCKIVNHALSGDKAANNSSILNVTLGYTENKTDTRWYPGKMFSFGTANRAAWGDNRTI